jgi:hypothetical protein
VAIGISPVTSLNGLLMIEPPGAFVWLANSRMWPWERCVELARLAEYWERRALDARRFCSGT